MNRLEMGQGIEFQDFLNGIVDDEMAHHPDVETDGDKISNIWGILGLTDVADLAKILGIKEKQISKVFEADMSGELKKRRLDRVFACASILERNFPNLSKRKMELERPHPFLRHKSPIQSLKQGHVDQVLYFASLSPSI
jgi:hypothetical protein